MIELNDLVEKYKLYSKIDEMGSKVVRLGALEEKVHEVVKEKKGNQTSYESVILCQK